MARSYASTHTPRASHQAQNARRRAFRTIVHSGVGTDGKRRIVSLAFLWIPASGEVHCITIGSITSTLRPSVETSSVSALARHLHRRNGRPGYAQDDKSHANLP